MWHADPVRDNAERRYAREQAFHDDRFEDETRSRARKYYEVDAGASRYRAHLDQVHTGAHVLEYGCGSGSSAFDLAARGVLVTGIDLSPVGVQRARADATARGVAAEFRVMNAEALELPDASFDVVCGSGILHHLDLDRALAEVGRVLKPYGRAVFFEPLGTNPLINLYRRLTPSMRTPDEHPLVAADLAEMRRRFEHVEVEPFNLLAIAGAPVRRLPGGGPIVRALQRLDRWLFQILPVTRRLAWVAVIELAGPVGADAAQPTG